MNRSFGERPVRSPVVASKTPCAVISASPPFTAVSCNSSEDKFQCTEPLGFNPCVDKGVAETAVVDEREVLSMYHASDVYLSTITDNPLR